MATIRLKKDNKISFKEINYNLLFMNEKNFIDFANELFDYLLDNRKSEPSGLRKTTNPDNSLAHRTTWLRSDLDYKLFFTNETSSIDSANGLFLYLLGHRSHNYKDLQLIKLLACVLVKLCDFTNNDKRIEYKNIFLNFKKESLIP